MWRLLVSSCFLSLVVSAVRCHTHPLTHSQCSLRWCYPSAPPHCCSLCSPHSVHSVKGTWTIEVDTHNGTRTIEVHATFFLHGELICPYGCFFLSLVGGLLCFGPRWIGPYSGPSVTWGSVPSARDDTGSVFLRVDLPTAHRHTN